MAVDAASRRRGKYTLYVAGFAGRHGMLELQREAGLVVIEFGSGIKCRDVTRVQASEHYQQQQKSRQLGYRGNPLEAGWRIHSPVSMAVLRLKASSD
jgi:hypothetical protein